VKTTLGRHCYHHAWHAELWHKRLPELREMRPDRLIRAPNAHLEAFVAALTEPEAPDLTIEKLVGVFRVLLPRKIAAYSYHLAATSRITDAPTIRSLGFILDDEQTDWQEGETDEEVARAARRQSELEVLITRAGGIAGPGSLGPSSTSSGPTSSGPTSQTVGAGS
jgi:hypothetical protein